MSETNPQEGAKTKLVDLIAKLETQPDEVIDLLYRMELRADTLEYIIELQQEEGCFYDDLMRLNDYIIITVIQSGESENFEGCNVSFEMAALNTLKYFRDFLETMIPIEVKKNREKANLERMGKFKLETENPVMLLRKILETVKIDNGID